MRLYFPVDSTSNFSIHFQFNPFIILFRSGLHGQLIPVAIPLALPHQDWLLPRPRSRSRSPAKPADVSYKKIVVKEHDREVLDFIPRSNSSHEIVLNF